MIKIDKCVFCGKSKFNFLYKTQDRTKNFEESFVSVECSKCKIIFLNPQPSFRELKKHYSGNYYSLNKIKSPKDSLLVKFRLFLYDTFFTNKRPPILKLIFLPFKNYLRGTVINKNEKLLDIGSGSGQFVYEMKLLGVDSLGVEPGDFDINDATKKGVKIIKGDLIASKIPKNSFDIITMNHVLEHVPNPIETLKELNGILKKGGTFIVGVPNTDSFAKKIFGKNWYQFDVPRHLFNYSTDNLKNALKKSGFKIKKIRYVSRPTQFTKSLRYVFGIKSMVKIEPILNVLFTPATYLFNLIKKGDSIEIWCEK